MNISSGRSYHIPRTSNLNMSAIPSSCSLQEILKTPCGSSRDENSHVLPSECNSDISVHFASCHLSKCSDTTKSELILARAGIQGLSATRFTSLTICPRHRNLLGKFWRAPKSCHYPCHTGKIGSVAGRHVINFQMVNEMMLLFGKIVAVGSCKYDHPLGRGVFFSVVNVCNKVYSLFLHSQCLPRQLINAQFLN